MVGLTETILDNGLTVLIEENHASPVVSCWAGYRVGARNEREGITGASHWVEHMTFKGTERLGKGEIFRLTARHGGGNNGFTSDDSTVYYETLPSSELGLALFIESQRMQSALFDTDETERERTVILAERSGIENNPHYELAERMGQTVFTRHPYRWPVIGTRADLERLTHAELLAHYRAYYVPNNAVLAIVGDVDVGAVLEQVRRSFESIPPGPAPPAVDASEPPQSGARRVEVLRPGANSFLQVLHRAPAWGHPDIYPLIVLDAVLSGARSVAGGGGYMGRSARIYRALVETRLAVSAGSGFRFMRDPYVFSASLTLRQDVPPERAEEALIAVLEEVAEKPPSPEELDRVVRQSEALFAYGREAVTSRASALLSFHLLGHWSDLERHVARLRAIAPEEVARVAATYLRPQGRTVGWFHPEEPGVQAFRCSGVQASGPSGVQAFGPSGVQGGSAQPSATTNTSVEVERAADSGTASRAAPERLNARTPEGRTPERRNAPPQSAIRNPQSAILDNGLTLLWHENDAAPSIAIRGSLPAGAAREALEQAGLAGMTARLLRRGTRRRSAQEIADAVEAVGASFAIWSGAEEAGFSARCLHGDLLPVLDLLEELMEQPAFEEAEIAKVRAEVMNALREQEESPRARADLAAYGALYPADHPYGRASAGTPETIAALTRDDFRNFHAGGYGARGLKISLSGRLEIDAVRRRLEGWFRGFPEPAPATARKITPAAPGRRLVVSMPHKSQVDLTLAGPGIPRQHPDYFALSMVSLILGGLGLMGRLGQRVRDELGMAYHVSCRANCRLWAGEWLATAGVSPANVEGALAAILQEVQRLRDELVTEEELADARSYLIGSLPLRMETNDGIAAYLLNAEYYGLGLDYLERYPGYILAETRESLREAARRHMDPARLVTAMAGPV